MKNRKPIEMSAIAELVFLTETTLNFPRIAAELERMVQASTAEPCTTGLIDDSEWWITAKGALFTLSHIKAPRRGVVSCLTLSVGPLPGAQSDAEVMEHHHLAERLLDKLQARVCADQTHWLRKSARPVAETKFAAYDGPQRLAPYDQRPVKVAPLPVHLSLVAANDQPDLPKPSACDEDLKRLRDALYFVDETVAAPVSTDQMRLAVHTMNATLIVVALPVGAAMLTYSLMRGDNLRATASALVATGLGFAMLQGPALQHFLSLVG